MKRALLLFVFCIIFCIGCGSKDKKMDENTTHKIVDDGYTLTWGIKNNLHGLWISEDGNALCAIQDNDIKESEDPVIRYMLYTFKICCGSEYDSEFKQNEGCKYR